MKSFATLAAAGIAAVLLAAPAAASVTSSGFIGASPAKAVPVQFAAVQCMTDDGYGRKRPCSALYKKENPNWRAGEGCMTSDGYGRYRPCSALYKQKHQKK
jgi:hypothetical protein